MPFEVHIPYGTDSNNIASVTAEKKIENARKWCEKTFGKMVIEPIPGAPSVMRISPTATRWYSYAKRSSFGVTFWFRLEADALLFKLTWA